MARNANKTGLDLYVQDVANGDIVNANDYMWGTLIGDSATIKASDTGASDDAVDWFSFDMATGGSDITIGAKSFSLDTDKNHLHVSGVTAPAILVLGGARNTPVVQPDTTYIDITVVARP